MCLFTRHLPLKKASRVESLICHPTTMTHASIPFEMRQEIAITDNLIRLSVGVENAHDIIEDLIKALEI